MIALLLAAAAAVPQTLPEVQQRLIEERAQAAKLAGRESSLLGRLSELERQVELEGRALRAAQFRLRTANQRLLVVEERARVAQAELDRANEVVNPRLMARYRMGREGYLRFLLGARSIAEVLRRRRLFNSLLEADLEALTVLKIHSDGAKAARDELAAARNEQSQSVQAEAERRAALESRAGEQRRLLASVQREKEVHEQAVRELEEAERELSQKLADIQSHAPPTAMVTKEIKLRVSIRRARGKLPFPLPLGKVEVHFGRATDPRFGLVTLQKGIDVRAPLGTPVHAIWEGKIVHAGWFKGFGHLMIIDHGDGFFSLMAHLDQLEKAVGDEVHRGDRVGTVGDSGSLKGPYLYFELRDGQKPLDPERWLSKHRKAPALLAGAKGGAAK
jgi:septal ring factor EnvC (AmiA/AmiB activator)